MKKAIITASMACLISGCIMIKENKLPIVNANLIVNDQTLKPSVFIDFKTNVDHDDALNKQDANLHASYFKRSLVDSRCCTIAGSKQQADILVEGFVRPINNPWIIIPSLISASTLFVVPYWDETKYETEVKVTMVDGGVRKYRLDDSVTLYYWLPLIAVSVLPPVFFHNRSADQRTVVNLYNNLLYKMKRENTLRPQ